MATTRTHLGIRGRDFLTNDRLVYSEYADSGDAQGLLMNARFIQGVFDDAKDRRRFDRFGRTFDPEANTDALIAALPQWHAHGLRALTVGFQGGWPVFTIFVGDIDNNPFGSDGTKLDDAYAARMDRVIRAADALGMVVIVNVLYWAQTKRLTDGRAIGAALSRAAAFIRNGGYTNVIVDLANEFDIDPWSDHPLIRTPECMQVLLDSFRRESGGGVPVGCSGGGGQASKLVIEASDVALVHGNGLTRGQYYDFIRRVEDMAGDKPIVCNEDSPAISRLEVARLTHTSWGHYDNLTKQEPPCDWSITPGQDTFFARRMARSVGIRLPELPLDEQFYLQGLEPHAHWQGKRWIRLAAEYPERVDHVCFRRNGEPVYTSYDEPFFMYSQTTWTQGPWHVRPDDKDWTAEVVLADGSVVTKTAWA